MIVYKNEVTVFDSDARHCLYSLARTGAFVVPLSALNGVFKVLRRRPTGDKAIGEFPQSIWTKFVTLGLVAPTEDCGEWRMTSMGRVIEKSVVHATGKRRPENSRSIQSHIEGRLAVRINTEESPLSWLARRKGRDGKPMLSPAQFTAGERLRDDFGRACLNPRVTMDWSTALSASGGRKQGAPAAGLSMSDAAAAARQRVNMALAAVGPELASILVDVCCYLKGLEVTEQQSGWPQRSAKVILLLALSSLARHYGLLGDVEGSAGKAGVVRHWGQDGYRPEMDSEAQVEA